VIPKTSGKKTEEALARNRAYQKAYREADLDRAYSKGLMRFYGIDITEFRRMHAEQGGVCAVCGGEEHAVDYRTGKHRRLAVDHCHKTGEVRALLCSKCNSALGNLRDDPALLRKAADYLDAHAARIAAKKALDT
jgi:hypothetical protein